MKSAVCEKLKPFGESIFAEMTRLAIEHDAINLSQGFPDFDGPDWLKDAACEAIRNGPNQYALTHGLPVLRKAIVEKTRRVYGLTYDPETEVTVFSGATEALFSCINGLINPGDEVILIEPYYDSYPACVAMAGGVPRYVALRWPGLTLDLDEVEAAITPRTRLIVLNTPNNPAGKVFSGDELRALSKLILRHNLILMTDEVYEHIIFDGIEHLPPAAINGLRERTMMISSTAKTFSMTGWKIGYMLAPTHLTQAARSAHQFVTFSSGAPFQAAMAVGIQRFDSYGPSLLKEYSERRDVLVDVLSRAGFGVQKPQGTYFVLADIRPLGFEKDVECCRYLTTKLGVAAIPASAFYMHKEVGQPYVRFAFCKNVDTLKEAGRRLAVLADRLPARSGG